MTELFAVITTISHIVGYIVVGVAISGVALAILAPVLLVCWYALERITNDDENEEAA